MKPIPLDAPALDVAGISPDNPRVGQADLGDFATQLANTHEDPQKEQDDPELGSMMLSQLDAPKTSIEPIPQSEARVDNLVTAVMNQCQVLSDEQGQKLVMMTLQIPGRGDVRVRLWKRKNGIDIRLKSADPAVATSLRNRQTELENNLRDKGIKLGKVATHDHSPIPI